MTFRLAIIIGRVLKDLYGIRFVSPECRISRAEQLRERLHEWRLEIAFFLETDESSLSPVFQRKSIALKMAYAHALILVHQTFLLNSLTEREDLQAKTQENLNHCLQAAMTIIEMVNDLYERDQAFSASWVESPHPTKSLASLTMNNSSITTVDTAQSSVSTCMLSVDTASRQKTGRHICSLPRSVKDR